MYFSYLVKFVFDQNIDFDSILAPTNLYYSLERLDFSEKIHCCTHPFETESLDLKRKISINLYSPQIDELVGTLIQPDKNNNFKGSYNITLSRHLRCAITTKEHCEA